MRDYGLASTRSEITRQFGPEVILPEQWRNGSRLLDSPQHRLLVALLIDAIRCFQNPRQRVLFLNAERWIMSGDRGLLSFDSVCFFLGLDPSSVRDSLQRRHPARHRRRGCSDAAVRPRRPW